MLNNFMHSVYVHIKYVFGDGLEVEVMSLQILLVEMDQQLLSFNL
jgi:hypothetical protein